MPSNMESLCPKARSQEENMEDESKESGKHDNLDVEYKLKLKELDEGATGLMKSLDLIFAIVKQLKFNLRLEDGVSNDDMKQNMESCKGQVLQLLLTTENMVLHHKAASTTAISKFVHFVHDSLQKRHESFPETFDLQGLDELALDRYVENQNTSYLYGDNKYCMEIIGKNEQLEKEVERLSEMKQTFDEIENTFYQEKKVWERDTVAKDMKISDLKASVVLIEKEKNQIMVQKESLERERNNFKALLETTKTERENLKSTIEENERKFDTSSDTKDKEIINLQKEVGMRNAEIEELKTTAEKQRLIVQTNEKEIKELKTSLKTRECKIKSQDEATEKMKSEIKLLEAKHSELSVSHDAMMRNENESKALGEKLKSTEAELSELKTSNAIECNDLKVSIKSKDSEIRALKDSLNNSQEALATEKQNASKITELSESLQKTLKNNKYLTKQYNQTTQSLDAMNKKLTELEKNNKELLDKNSNLAHKENELKQRKAMLEHQKKEMAERHSNECEKLNTVMKKKENELEEKILRLKSEKTTLEIQQKKLVEQHRNECAELKTIIKKKENEMEEQIKRLKSEKTTLKIHQNELVEQHRHECDELNTVLKKKENEMEQQMKHLKTELEKYKDKSEKLEEQVNKTQYRLKTLNSELNESMQNIRQFEEKIKILKRDNEKEITVLKGHLQSSDHECAKLKVARENGDIEQRRLKSELRLMELKLQENEEELSKMRRKRITEVQVYVPNRGDLISNIEDALTALLKSEMDTDRKALHFVQCARSSDIKPYIPVLLLCITASRIGTDVQNVIQGLSVSPKMAVVIFHHKDIHALPNQGSDRVLTGKELKSLGGIFDMAFLTDKGIYPCPMNRNNVINLKNFIDREGLEDNVK